MIMDLGGVNLFGRTHGTVEWAPQVEYLDGLLTGGEGQSARKLGQNTRFAKMAFVIDLQYSSLQAIDTAWHLGTLSSERTREGLLNEGTKRTWKYKWPGSVCGLSPLEH